MEGRAVITDEERRRLSQATRQAWDECFGDQIERRKRWQMYALLSWGATALAICGVMYLGTLPKQVVIPIEVDKAGHVLNVKNLKDKPLNTKLWDAIYRDQFQSFIEDWRGVTSDTTAQNAMWDRVFKQWVGSGSQAESFLTSWYEQNDPASILAKQKLVRVHWDTSDRPGQNTYGVWWTEYTTSLSGGDEEVKRWHCVFTFTQKKDDIGILITEIRLEPVNG